MKIKDIKKICRLENGAVDCEVLFFGVEEYLPYTASPEDMDETGQQIWQELQSGKWGEIAPFTASPELIAAAKDAKKREIEAWRTEQEAQPFTFEWNGRAWNGGADSISRIAPVAMATKVAGTRSTLGWGDAANNLVTLTMAQLQELAAAMARAQVEHNDEIYQRQRELKEELSSLGDLNSVRNFIVE
ncbi:DUF4376 domain-containing protein [Escherichia coli]|nr:DUF4376 domain-containing protein [Escherichia coli]